MLPEPTDQHAACRVNIHPPSPAPIRPHTVAGAGYMPPTRTVRKLWRSLPGRAVTAAMIVNGELWIITDPRKRGAAEQADKMMQSISPRMSALLHQLGPSARY
jgi:hypothetical protein